MVQPAQNRRGDHLSVFRESMTGRHELILFGQGIRNPGAQAGMWAAPVIVAHQPSAFAFALARPKESATRPIGIRNTPRRVISSEGIDHGKARPKAEAGSDNRILREAGVE